ncbi:hypothetical protein TKK_0002966 [Trichogramma kaykai]
MTGLTGTIKFDNQGFRSDFTLEIMELNTKNGLEEIGSWNSSFGINFTRSFREVYTQMIDSLQNKSFIVTTILRGVNDHHHVTDMNLVLPSLPLRSLLQGVDVLSTPFSSKNGLQAASERPMGQRVETIGSRFESRHGH